MHAVVGQADQRAAMRGVDYRRGLRAVGGNDLGASEAVGAGLALVRALANNRTRNAGAVLVEVEAGPLGGGARRWLERRHLCGNRDGALGDAARRRSRHGNAGQGARDGDGDN